MNYTVSSGTLNPSIHIHRPLQLISPPFLITSTTKQMLPNGKQGAYSCLCWKCR